ncbi:ThiF family adenylyltransferase [Mucilaginibacter sp.]|uniref:ThiF family adenylyltransferase n=1 Tax=Mucilaginibacter sp. TaxID=1882438 RepID=UPI003B00767E
MDINFTQANEIYLPKILRLNNSLDISLYNDLIKNNSVLVYDCIYNQLQELIKCQNPSVNIQSEEYAEYISKHLQEQNINNYGVWVYYPWNNKLIHLLDKEEFIKVRTNRNQYKITNNEQQLLNTKKIGIVGLSVGQSIALTMAIERTCGELRLADFDTVELSNLNRLRAPLHSLGLKKTVIAAREILEIDPFISVKVYNDGLNSDNIDTFFTEGGNLDLFVEVCDGLDIKIQSRYKARELKIPVVMDTNDRGMLDVERFDLEPNRAILHGRLGNSIINTQNMAPNEKLDLIYKIIDVDKISSKLKFSIPEIGKSINTWPQLASSTFLGGAVTTDISRKILLGNHTASGRYYVDFDEILST